jgi:ESCRT-II complex subunit VPS36
MLLLEGVALTSSGRPVLAPEELELKILEKTDFEFEPAKGGGGLPGDVRDKYVGGVAVLTSHRLMWLDPGAAPRAGLSCCVHLVGDCTS